MLMPFGQYKGWNLNDVPINYLLWLSEEADIFGQLKWSVTAILEEKFKERDAIGAGQLTAEDRKRLIVLSPRDIRNWWAYYVKVFSETFFGYTLRAPAIKIDRSRRWMGYWAPEPRQLCINNHYILPQERFENILVHEMCHQYVSDRGILDTSAHGRRWRNIAARMSSATGNPITICDEQIYAPNIYYKPDQLVILPPKPESQSKKGNGKLLADDVEASYSGFIEELSNM